MPKIKISKENVGYMRNIWQSPIFVLFMALWIFTMVPAFGALISDDGGPLIALAICLMIPGCFVFTTVSLAALDAIVPLIKKLACAIFEVTDESDE